MQLRIREFFFYWIFGSTKLHREKDNGCSTHFEFSFGSQIGWEIEFRPFVALSRTKLSWIQWSSSFLDLIYGENKFKRQCILAIFVHICDLSVCWIVQKWKRRNKQWVIFAYQESKKFNKIEEKTAKIRTNVFLETL